MVICADITTQSADAIVNSAHTSLLEGSGLSGLIHRAAGLELELAWKEIGGCPTGSAVLTPGFKLAAKHVIHAVGDATPIFHPAITSAADLGIG